jgi:hypothetical protein
MDNNDGEHQVETRDLFLEVTEFGLNFYVCPIRQAIRNNDRDLALQLIEQGHDPFKSPGDLMICIDEITAFHEASARGDVGLLLAMAAEPGSPWTKRFLVCSSEIVEAPTQGRRCIPSLSGECGESFFQDALTVSMEGLEVACMYGYTLKTRDFAGSILLQAMGGDPRKVQMFKFGLAVGRGEHEKLCLEQCLGNAIGGDNSCFFNGSHPTSYELARILLKAGANPNGYCFQGGTPYDFVPAIFQSLKNRDVEMTKLLLAYGADLSQNAQFSNWEREEGLDFPTESIQSKATEVGMEDLLIPHEDNLMTADPGAYVKELRQDLTTPIRLCVADQSAILTVAMMRFTGFTAPLGMFSQMILEYCPLGFELWAIDASI